MVQYQKLLDIIDNEKIYLIETNKIGSMKGLYFDNHIALNTNIDTLAEKKCVLAEEIGHHYYNYGDIIDLEDTRNIKQEKLGRAWAFEQLLPLSCFIDAFNGGIKNRFELSRHLELTEEFIDDAIKYYKKKYGNYCEYNDIYTIQFEPCFGVWKNIV